MTLWNPEYRVKINSTIVTSVTLSGLTITSGRTDIYTQPTAGYANVTLIETNQRGITYEINDQITVEVKNTAGTYQPIFGGYISDVSITIQSSGSTALTQRINIIAVGTLAKLNRSTFTGSFSKEFDGTRIYNLLTDLLVNSWSEVPAAETWANYDATTTWANAENIGLGQIDTPGDYELAALNGQSGTVYELATFAAQSGFGYLYEDSQGRIGYADSTHRTAYLSANGYVDLDGNHALGPALQVIKRAGDVRNSVTLAYGASGSANVTVQDTQSISDYGLLASNVVTCLHNSADATTQANALLSFRAYPRYGMKQITFPLASSEIDDADREALLAVLMGLPIRITNLPINMLDGTFEGFVEGWTWTASLGRLDLTLNVSPLEFSIVTTQWSQVNSAESWNTLSATLDWLDATIVA